MFGKLFIQLGISQIGNVCMCSRHTEKEKYQDSYNSTACELNWNEATKIRGKFNVTCILTYIYFLHS
jgi:hypothetical protein